MSPPCPCPTRVSYLPVFQVCCLAAAPGAAEALTAASLWVRRGLGAGQNSRRTRLAQPRSPPPGSCFLTWGLMSGADPAPRELPGSRARQGPPCLLRQWNPERSRAG